MLGKNSGKTTKSFSLNLKVKDSNKESKLLSNAMDISEEIVILLKYLPKREAISGPVKKVLKKMLLPFFQSLVPLNGLYKQNILKE